MELWQRDGAGIDEMHEAGITWDEIGIVYGCTGNSARKRHKRWKRKKKADTPAPLPPPLPTITGHTAKDEVTIDEGAVWAQAIELANRHKESQGKEDRIGRLEWETGPVAIVTMADLHLGSYGTDYEWLDRDISLILGTPGMYVVLNGDLIDGFIIGRLQELRKSEAPFTIGDEWALVRRVLRRLAPRLVASCSGNHDLWTVATSGIDYLADVHSQLNAGILYHKYDLRFDVRVGKTVVKWRVRHAWPGHSQYNPVHGITKQSKFDKGVEFDVGVGAHTHASGLFQEFNNGGKTGYAILCGSYKLHDRYKEARGFPDPNDATAVTTIIHEDGFIHGSSDLEGCCNLMKMYYAG
jgi:hypothetical protein